jgi:hypothetical protein
MKGKKGRATDSKRVVITARCPLDPIYKNEAKAYEFGSTRNHPQRGREYK